MDSKTMVYMGITLLIVVLSLLTVKSYGAYGIIVVIFAVLAFLTILAVNYADFLLFPAITYVLNLRISPAKGYIIPKSQNCIIKSVNGLYYATGFITANVYSYVFSQEGIEFDQDEKLAAGPEKWERLVMSVKFPFRFSMMTYAKDIQKYREDLESKSGYLSFQLSRESGSSSPNQMTIDDLQKRINAIQTQIDRLTQDERPVTSIMYMETIAVGVSEKAAMDVLENQISKLETVANSLDLNAMRVTGRELYQLFEFNYHVPERPVEFTQLFNEER